MAKSLYKVTFLNHGKVYELYARSVASGQLWGFTEIGGLVVGAHDGARWSTAVGGLTFDPDARLATPHTIFDLASLTKVIATTTLAMRGLDASRIQLSDPLGRLQ